MKGCILGLLYGLWALALPALAVTVTGRVSVPPYLETPQQWVLFIAVSPSAVTDSAYTSTIQGDFTAELAAGVYRIRYRYSGYATYELPPQALVTATTLAPVILMHSLSGNVSGVLGLDMYDVVDTLFVDTLQTLILRPATQLFFRPGVPLIVRGSLVAAGASDARILFTRRDDRDGSEWGGIGRTRVGGDPELPAGTDTIHMNYCRVEYARGGVELDSLNGRSIDRQLSHCQIFACGISAADQISHALSMYGGTLTMSDCEIDSSRSVGLYLNSTQADISSTEIRNNPHGGVLIHGRQAEFTGCRIAGNAGGGIESVYSSDLFLADCVIENNANDYGGGGVELFEGVDAWITRCIFRENRTTYLGGAIHSTAGHLTVEHCLLANNSAGHGGAIYGNNVLDLRNCTIVGNPSGYTDAQVITGNPSFASIRDCIIAGGNGYGIILSTVPEPGYLVEYNCFFANAAGAISMTQAYVPPAFGQLVTTNAGGDSADTYYNIFFDPQFTAAAAGDYHLTATSPCIDAGDPVLPQDPDGTVADIGAYSFDAAAAPAPMPVAQSFALYPCYPNPFNVTARIAFDLPRAARVQLQVFDITGRHVVTLLDAPQSAGRHEASFDGAALASGLYFARLSTPTQSATQKLVLIK